MNDIIALLQAHRSIRKFTADPVKDEHLAAIVGSAQMASTSSNVQAYTVIQVTDPVKKKELAALCGNQAYVEQCPVFLVWCADLYRLEVACRIQKTEMTAGTTENLLIATIDAALAAQNAAVAAESLGYGITYIGGIRNRPQEVAELLGLPRLVYPVFGMCLGVPDQQPGVRPRLARTAVCHKNGYQADVLEEEIARYDEQMRDYYIERTGGRRDTTWSREMADKFRSPTRPHMKRFLQERGFLQD
ncbi:NADPH-dependent oxidoreductase [Paenibacillus sp. J31TS4]|uniref:oxygen-insensitive NADPH nitroreductase n=1 Tax=Paenibacillus sp. J31TS4 TaxID=2807195 RepID=UPI001AFE3ECD|nr:oxygen-insensitive NADPH nitroreductase [Paenibacillus sp. J31TS4]GIP41153.1 NADPH-dependent oxidoreductase [Paenibacillus sp. J31TS4]